MPNPSRDTKLSGANADREILFFPIQPTTSRIGNLLTRLIHTLAICVTIHDERFRVVYGANRAWQEVEFFLFNTHHN